MASAGSSSRRHTASNPSWWKLSYGHPVPIAEMKKHLDGGKFRAVLIQATESSTGVRNDIQSLGQIVSALPDTCFVVDAITGLGTTDILPDQWGIDLMIGGSQKATMIAPGLSFASVSEKAWKTIENSKLPRYYFDYAKERKTLTNGESSYHAGRLAGSDVERGAELHQAIGPRET